MKQMDNIDLDFNFTEDNELIDGVVSEYYHFSSDDGQVHYEELETEVKSRWSIVKTLIFLAYHLIFVKRSKK